MESQRHWLSICPMYQGVAVLEFLELGEPPEQKCTKVLDDRKHQNLDIFSEGSMVRVYDSLFFPLVR